MHLFKLAMCLLLVSASFPENTRAQEVIFNRGASNFVATGMLSYWRLIVNRVFLSQLAAYPTDHPNYVNPCEENAAFKDAITPAPDGSLTFDIKLIKLRLGSLTPALTGHEAQWPFQCTPVRIASAALRDSLQSGWVHYRMPCLGNFPAFLTALSEVLRNGWSKSTQYHLSSERQLSIGKFHTEMGGGKHNPNESIMNKQMLELVAHSRQLDSALEAIDTAENLTLTKLDGWCEVGLKLKPLKSKSFK